MIDWLAGMTDRFAVRDVRRPLRAAGVLSVALFTKDSIDRVREAIDMVELVGAQDRPAARRQPLAGAVPVPRRAHAVVLGQPRGQALLLLRLPEGRRRDRLRAGGRGARLPGGGRDARRALQRPARARGRRSRGRQASGSSGSACSGLLDRTARFYASFLESSEEAAKARAYLAERGLLRGGAERVPGGVLAERVGPGAGGRPAGRLLTAGAARRRAWRSATDAATSTTASAAGSCSRSRTPAAGCSDSGPARCRRDAGRST